LFFKKKRSSGKENSCPIRLLPEIRSLPLFTIMRLTHFFPPIVTNCLSQTMLTKWR